jgi:hypothetical protein
MSGTYRDIDISLDNNTSGDVAVKIDLEAVKATLYNNLLISPPERYFDNSYRMDMRDLIHEPETFLVRKQIKDAVNEAITLDKRINSLEDIQYNFDDVSNLLILELYCNIDLDIPQTVVPITLIFEKV